MKSLLLCILLIGIYTANRYADELQELSLNDLLNLPVSVATISKSQVNRESPGIVTIITSDEIKRLGARDLIDILRLVPGLNFGFDISGVVGLGIRGNWANEGKVLILIDGIEMNDDMYASFEYGQHLPVDLIDRIEIIRGPGSAMYGGSAELGVISIITKPATKTNNALFSATYGRMKDATGRRNISSFMGGKTENVTYSTSVHAGMGIRSDRVATDLWGETFKMAADDNSTISEFFVNSAIQVQDLKCRVIIDRYQNQFSYPSYGISDYSMGFYSYIVNSAYDLSLSENLVVSPRIQYKRQQPWDFPVVVYDDGTEEKAYENSLTSEKITCNISSSFDLSEEYNISGGLMYDRILGTDELHTNGLGGENNVSYNKFSVFAQGLFNTPYSNITLGGRFSYHDQYETSIVPRLALTKIFRDILHVKLLASQALREPTIRNIGYNPKIKPEKTRALELEIGAKLIDQIFIAANAFDLKITDAIVYTYSSVGSNYENSGETGTRGLELTTKYKSKWIDADIGYALARVTTNNVKTYIIPDEPDLNLGFPAHKISASTSIKPMRSLYITPNLMYLSQRWANDSSDASWNLFYHKQDAQLLLNLSVLYEDLLFTGLDISLSVFNIMDDEYLYIQPYIGYDAPVPGPSREWVFKFIYHF